MLWHPGWTRSMLSFRFCCSCYFVRAGHLRRRSSYKLAQQGIMEDSLPTLQPVLGWYLSAKVRRIPGIDERTGTCYSQQHITEFRAPRFNHFPVLCMRYLKLVFPSRAAAGSSAHATFAQSKLDHLNTKGLLSIDGRRFEGARKRCFDGQA